MNLLWLYYLVFFVVWLMVEWSKKRVELLKDLETSIVLTFIFYAMSLAIMFTFFACIVEELWIFKIAVGVALIIEAVVLLYGSVMVKEFLKFRITDEQMAKSLSLNDDIFAVVQLATITLMWIYDMVKN